MDRGQWEQSLSSELQRLQGADLLRGLRDRTDWLDFCSNDYLSLNSSGRLFKLLEESLERVRPFVGSTGSRLIRGQQRAFESAEAGFARWVGFPDSLLFHSGQAANFGLIAAVVGRTDRVLADERIHASIIDGIRLAGARRHSFRHNDLDDLERQLARATTGSAGRGQTAVPSGSEPGPESDLRGASRRTWIFVESLYSMDGDRAPLPDLVVLAERHGALLVVDEAHAVGALGPEGAGLVAQAGLQSRVAAAVFPCGKAMGLMGAFVCGPAALKQWLVNRARTLIFSTAQPPLLAELLAGIVGLMPELDSERRRLAENARALRELLTAAGLEIGAARDQIIPVLLGSAARALAGAEALAAHRIDGRAIRPPSVPAGQSRLRLTVQADHAQSDLELVVRALTEARPSLAHGAGPSLLP